MPTHLQEHRWAALLAHLGMRAVVVTGGDARGVVSSAALVDPGIGKDDDECKDDDAADDAADAADDDWYVACTHDERCWQLHRLYSILAMA
jgi:hypothetical protein